MAKLRTYRYDDGRNIFYIAETSVRKAYAAFCETGNNIEYVGYGNRINFSRFCSRLRRESIPQLKHTKHGKCVFQLLGTFS
jgi:hypothetical protein